VRPFARVANAGPMDRRAQAVTFLPMNRAIPTAWLAVLLLLVGVVPAHAQDAAAAEAVAAAHDVDPAYASPRDTMRTFLESITAVRERVRERELAAAPASAWAPVMRCFDLAGADMAPGSFEAKRAAERMLAVLDHIREVDVAAELPGVAGLEPGQDAFTYFPKPFNPEDDRVVRLLELDGQHITFARGADGSWRFSADTLAGLPTLYDAAMRRGDRKVKQDDRVSVLQRFMPRSLVTRRWLDVMYWQWIALGVLILAGVVLDFVVRAALRVLIAARVNQRQGEDHAEAIAGAARPLGMFVTGVFWLTLLPVLALPLTAHQILHGAAAIWAVLAGVWAAWKLTDLAAEVLVDRAAKTTTKLDDILIPLLSKALKVFIVAIGIVYGADALDIPIGPMVASLGIGGLAFAFAAKDTIENFFGSVAVILDRPFEVGDWVVIDDKEGTVEELGFRSTRIRTFYNSQITIPNASLVRAAVDNYGRRKYRRWKTTLGVQYDTTPEQLLAFTEGIRELVRTHPYTRKDYYQVWCNDYGDSSLDILLYVFFEVPDWNTELRERERLFVDIVRLADQLGVSFAFPTTTVHLFKEEHPRKGEPYHPEHEAPGKTSDRRAFVKGIRAAQKLVKNQSWRDNKPGPQTYGQVGMTQLDDAPLDPADATENTQSPPPDPGDDASDDTKRG